MASSLSLSCQLRLKNRLSISPRKQAFICLYEKGILKLTSIAIRISENSQSSPLFIVTIEAHVKFYALTE